MYNSLGDSSKINLWYDRKVCDEDDLVPKKKIENEQDIDDIFHDLKEKHSKMEEPKLRLWAKLIQSGRHESYETPPPIPFITGGTNAAETKKGVKLKLLLEQKYCNLNQAQ